MLVSTHWPGAYDLPGAAGGRRHEVRQLEAGRQVVPALAQRPRDPRLGRAQQHRHHGQHHHHLLQWVNLVTICLLEALRQSGVPISLPGHISTTCSGAVTADVYKCVIVMASHWFHSLVIIYNYHPWNTELESMAAEQSSLCDSRSRYVVDTIATWQYDTPMSRRCLLKYRLHGYKIWNLQKWLCSQSVCTNKSSVRRYQSIISTICPATLRVEFALQLKNHFDCNRIVFKIVTGIMFWIF